MSYTSTKDALIAATNELLEGKKTTLERVESCNKFVFYNFGKIENRVAQICVMWTAEVMGMLRLNARSDLGQDFKVIEEILLTPGKKYIIDVSGYIELRFIAATMYFKDNLSARFDIWEVA